jgi:hypothetical protein
MHFILKAEKSCCAGTIIPVILVFSLFAEDGQFHARGKKLIEFGWDVPDAQFVRDNISTMEQRPFDGVCFLLSEATRLGFGNKIWSDTDMQYAAVSAIQWSKFTHNLILYWAMSRDNDPDWYSDSLWNIILANTRKLSKAVALARCKGIMFDPEFYYHNETYSPWYFINENKEYYPGKTYAEVAAKVRQRGGQFVKALQEEMPQIDFITLFGYSLPYAQTGNKGAPFDSIQYALMPAFFDGILDSCTSGFVFIDGHEGGYYETETREYFDSKNYMKVKSATAVAPELRSRYAARMQAGEATALDYCYSGWWDTTIATFPIEYRQKWFEHNIYHSLLSTDQYVWLYSELGSRGEDSWDDPLNWWSTPPKYIPDGFEEAILSAKKKLNAGEALGFDMVKNGDAYWDGQVMAVFVDSPSFSITAPRWDDTITEGRPIPVTFTAPSSGIKRIEVYVNSAMVKEIKSSPWQFSLDTLSSGDYTIAARLFTTDNNHRTSNPVTFTVTSATGAIYVPARQQGNRILRSHRIFDFQGRQVPLGLAIEHGRFGKGIYFEAAGHGTMIGAKKRVGIPFRILGTD